MRSHCPAGDLALCGHWVLLVTLLWAVTVALSVTLLCAATGVPLVTLRWAATAAMPKTLLCAVTVFRR